MNTLTSLKVEIHEKRPFDLIADCFVRYEPCFDGPLSQRTFRHANINTYQAPLLTRAPLWLANGLLTSRTGRSSKMAKCARCLPTCCADGRRPPSTGIPSARSSAAMSCAPRLLRSRSARIRPRNLSRSADRLSSCRPPRHHTFHNLAAHRCPSSVRHQTGDGRIILGDLHRLYRGTGKNNRPRAQRLSAWLRVTMDLSEQLVGV